MTDRQYKFQSLRALGKNVWLYAGITMHLCVSGAVGIAASPLRIGKTSIGLLCCMLVAVVEVPIRVYGA